MIIIHNLLQSYTIFHQNQELDGYDLNVDRFQEQDISFGAQVCCVYSSVQEIPTNLSRNISWVKI